MPLVVSNAGEIELLNKMLRNTSDTENYILKLYRNNYTPTATSSVSDFTSAIFTNYSDKTLARTSWTAATTVAGKAQSSYSQQSWTCGATGDTVYGYYVVGQTSGVLLWAEKFSIARPLANTDILNLTPVFTLNSEN